MYLNIMKNKNTGKTSLSICRGFRDENGKVKHTTIKSLGLLETLKNDYDDPIAHFEEVVKQMNDEEKNNNTPLTVTIDKNEELEIGTDNIKNFGYSALSKIYHELEIDKFLISKFKARNFSEYKINNIMKLLVLVDAYTLTPKNLRMKIKIYFSKILIFL